MMFTDNPIWYRERQASANRACRQRWWARTPGIALVWAIPVVTVLCVGAVTNGGLSNPMNLRYAVVGAAFVSIYLQVLYLCFKGLVAGAGAIARERELQTMETLLSTPLQMRRLAGGKFVVAAVPLLLEAVIAFPFSFLLLLEPGCTSRYEFVPMGLLGLSLACVVFFTSVGLLLSSKASSSTRASSQAVVVGILLFAGTYLLDIVMWAMTASGYGSPTLYFTLLNPYAALTSLLYVGRAPDMLAWAWALTISIYVLAWPVLMHVTARRLNKAVAS